MIRRPPRSTRKYTRFPDTTLVRADRAGRLLHAECASGHRFLERPAAAGAQFFVSRYPDQKIGQPELHPYPDQCAQMPDGALPAGRAHGDEIGRASCRERVCQYVYISVVAVALKKKGKTQPKD